MFRLGEPLYNTLDDPTDDFRLQLETRITGTNSGHSWTLLFDSHRQLSDCAHSSLTFGIQEPRLHMGYVSAWYRPMHPRF